MYQPFISVCIPTYNGEKYLQECLESILSQTYTSFEVLIIDDGSSDSTIQIIKEYEQKFNNFSFIANKKNLGLVKNWNHCILKAKGEWVKLFFQDDVMKNNCLEKLVENISDDDYFVINERAFIIEDNASDKLKRVYNNLNTLEKFGIKEGKVLQLDFFKLLRKYFLNNFLGEPSSIMFKKDLIKEIGLFDSNLKQLCDFEFAVRIISNYGFVYIPEKLTSFRVHGSSASSSNHSSNYFNVFFLDNLIILNYYLYYPSYIFFRDYLIKNLGGVDVISRKLIRIRKLAYNTALSNNDINFLKGLNDLELLYPSILLTRKAPLYKRFRNVIKNITAKR